MISRTFFRFILGLWIVLFSQRLEAQKAPKWLREVPLPAKGYVYGVGCSDLGLEPAEARAQARRRARFMAALTLHPLVKTTAISSVISSDLKSLDIDPRVSFAIDVTIPKANFLEEHIAQTFESDGIIYVLFKGKAVASAEPEGTSVRFFRDDSQGLSNVSLTVSGLSDSLFIQYSMTGDLTEYATEWPKIEERVRFSDRETHLPSKMPVWVSKWPSRAGIAHSTVDVVTVKGRFSPFMSLLQAFILTVGELNQTLGPDYMVSEDPYEVNGQTSFATLTRYSENTLSGLELNRIQVSRLGTVYQTYLRTSLPVRN